MGNNVFANGREISCKAADGKAVCAFPDVCLTPPTPPAGFIPVPYPNTGMASDASNGSTTVKISGKEVMLKNKSFFKKSTGDEAATRSTPMGVVTHTITGKVYFNSWSMDVKVEGENVVRHLDLTTHNHMSYPGNSPPWPYVDTMEIQEPGHPCLEDQMREVEACKDFAPYGEEDVCRQLGPGKPKQSKSSFEAPQTATIAAADDCLAARRCALQPYDPSGCCQPQTPHHLIEASAVAEQSPHSVAAADVVLLDGIQDYDYKKAPCVCAEGTSQHVGTHGQMHTFQREGVTKAIEAGTIVQEDLPLTNGGTTNDYATTYGDAKQNAVDAFKKTFPESECNPECLKRQLDNYHNQCNMDDSTKLKAVREGSTDVAAAEEMTVDRSHSVHLARQAMGRG